MFSEHFYPNSRKLEELVRPVDVFSTALEIRNAGTSSGCFTPS